MPDVWFPNLGIEIENLSRTAFSVFGIDVYWYGIFIGAGLIISTWLAMRYMKKIGGNPDDVMDFMLYAIIFCIIGARLYYVAFEWNLYKDNPMEIFNLREGGLAIYGGIIAAIIFGIFFVRKRKLNFWHMADVMIPYVPFGQSIGRWGNFFNREAFGGYTDGIFAMRYKLAQVSGGNLNKEVLANTIIENGVEYIQVHPTFLYESLWNIGVFIALLLLRKSGKFTNRIFAWYIILYGVGRMWIEGLRTDSLYLFSSGIRVSQALSIFMIAIGVFLLWFFRDKKPENMQKNRNNE